MSSLYVYLENATTIIIINSPLLQYERSYGKKYAGVELFVKSRIHLTPAFRLTGTPFLPFSGPNRVVVELRPTASTPEEFEIKAEAIFGTHQRESMNLNMKSFWVSKSIESSESSSSSSSSESGSDSKTISEESKSSSESTEKRRHRTAASKSKDFSSEEFEYKGERSLKTNEFRVEVCSRI